MNQSKTARSKRPSSRANQGQSNNKELAHFERTVKSGKNYSRWNPPVAFGGIGFPDRLRCTLKYRANYLQFSGVSPAAQVFRINSLYDPDLTNTGHQPNFYDQLTSSIYQQYLVMGAQVEVEIFNLNNEEGLATCVGLYSDANNSGLTTEALQESRYAKSVYSGLFQGGQAIQKLVMPFISIGQLQGLDTKYMNSDPSLYSAIGSNPVDQAYFIFKASSQDGSSSIALGMNFTIYFDCLFKELQDVTESLVFRYNNIHKDSSTPDSRKLCSNVPEKENSNGACRCPDREVRSLYLACCPKCQLE
jgi:hypothetical protein